MTLIHPQRRLYDIFREQVDHRPRSAYLTCGEQALTYHQASLLVDNVAAQIAGAVSPNGLIALNYKDPIKFMISFWACVQLDLSMVLVPNLSRESADLLLKKFSSNHLMLTDYDGFGNTLQLSFDLQIAEAEKTLSISSKSNNSIYFFSSGTTGQAKLVKTNYFQFVNALNCLSKERLMPYIDQQHVLITLPLYHSYGLSAALEYTMGGSHLYLPAIAASLESIRYLTNPKTCTQLTAIEGVPYFYKQMLLMISRMKLSNICHLGMGGDSVTAGLLAALRNHLSAVSFSIRYGITDIPSVIGLNYMKANDSFVPGFIGQILPIYRPRFAQTSLDLHIPQELLIDCWIDDGTSLSIATGDLFSRHNNLLYFESRQVFIKYRGFKINPVVIESCLEEHPQIFCSKVFLDGDHLSAEVVLQEDIADYGDIRRFLSRKLPAHHIPDRWIQVTTIERTKSGKIKRSNPQ